jgi:hypothetical protein
MPPVGQNVIATLANGEEILAYWLDGSWWVGVENNPEDSKVMEFVVSWREAA